MRSLDKLNYIFDLHRTVEIYNHGASSALTTSI